jgi:hypothetical protein
VDNNKMDLTEIRWGGMDWIDRAQDRDQSRALVNTAINTSVAQNFGELFSSYKIGGVSRTTHLYGVI